MGLKFLDGSRLNLGPWRGGLWQYSQSTVPFTLPVPLASDSFNRASLGSTDGAGHAFPGGSGVAWINQHGTWSIDSNHLRCSVLGSSPAFGVVAVETGATDVVAFATPTTPVNSMGVVVRIADAQNYVIGYISATGNAVLRAVVGGSLQAAVISATTTYVAGAEIAVLVRGTSFSLYYNGVLQGTATIATAALQTGTRHGVWTNVASSTVYSDTFSVWPLSEPATVSSLRSARVYREGATDFLVRVPIPGETNRIVAEYRLRKIDNILAGWAAPSNCWHILGLRVIDLDSVATTRILSATEDSAFEYAYTIGADADVQGDYNFFGSIHQAQVGTAFTISLDGTDISTLPIGLTAYGNQLTVTQAMNTIYPKDKTTVIGASALTHLFDRTFVQVEHAHTYSAGYRIFAAYSAMLPTSNADAAGIDTYQVGSETEAARVYDDGAKNLNTQTALVMGRHSAAHSYRVLMTLPDNGPDVDGDWQYAGGYKAWFNDRAPSTSGTGKFYINWVSTNFADRITAAASQHRTRYQVVKV